MAVNFICGGRVKVGGVEGVRGVINDEGGEIWVKM
jgi:hypothetical protein